MDDAQLYARLARREPLDSTFVCVTSTGIICRFGCPARTPKRENCRFVHSLAEGVDSGFRPCKRCRPEIAHG